MRKKLLATIVCVLGLFGAIKAQSPETIAIGSGEGATNNVPSYTNYYYSITQQIFTAAEMQNKTGEISSVAFKCTRNTSDPGLTRHFKIYMLNTSKSSFTGASDWVSVQESNLVFDGTVTFAAVGEWTTINFTTPFQYKNAKNILLCVNDVTGTGTWGYPKFASETKSEDRCIYTRSYNSSPYDATAISVDGTTSKDVNQVQFTITVGQGGGEDPEPVTPATPANLTATPGETSVVLTWDEVTEATSYYVYKGGELLVHTTGTTYTVKDLQASTTYCFTVTALKNSVESEPSNEACATTDEPALPVPSTPTNVVATAQSTSEIILSWNAVDGATAYGIYYRGEFMGTVDAPATSFKLNDLNYNTEYCFQVSAFNGDLESGKSDEVCAKTLGESISENANGFNIYPNPVENQLFIETEMNIVEVSVYDVYGRKLSAISNQQSAIDVAELNSGVYFVKVVTDNGETVKRFFKK